MTTVRVLSDLHLEFRGFVPPPAPADVVVCAGDIDVGARGMEWARSRFPDTPVVYVAGNHEFFGARFDDTLVALRTTAARLGIHFLDAGEVVLAGVRFLGATLWTDFELYGAGPERIEQSMHDAKRYMRDYRAIRWGEQGKFRPHHSLSLHREQVRWLGQKLREPFAGATVVVTHHLPLRQSVHPRYEGDALNPAFASDLPHLVRAPACLWIHGHTHESLDYVANGTRIVCNPRGYIPMQPNPAFDPVLVVEASARDGTDQRSG